MIRVGVLILAVGAKASEDDWVLGPFTRLEHENPALETRHDTTFNCPLQGRNVFWEKKDVFNPAAVVRDNKVHLLYRAEDHDGKPYHLDLICARREAAFFVVNF